MSYNGDLTLNETQMTKVVPSVLLVFQCEILLIALQVFALKQYLAKDSVIINVRVSLNAP